MEFVINPKICATLALILDFSVFVHSYSLEFLCLGTFTKDASTILPSLATTPLKTRKKHLAEDIVQEVFLKAFRSIDTLKETQKFQSW